MVTTKMNSTAIPSQKPLVSIVVPVYGVEKYIQKCIDSLVAQNFNRFEVILVDDGTKDRSGDICDENAARHPHILQVIHQKNTGLGGARNTGIRAAKGRYIMFVDSDDYIHPDTVAAAYNTIHRLGADMVGFGVNFVNEDGRILRTMYDGRDFGTALDPTMDPSLILNVPNAWNKIYRTDLFTDHNIWFPDRAWYEDIRTTIKLYAVAKKIAYIEEAFYYYVQRKESIMHSSNVDRNGEILDAFDDIFDYYRKNNLTEKYYSELEHLAILNVYMAASGRVAGMDATHKLLPQFKKYLSDHFPQYRKNRYMPTMTLRRRVLFWFLELRLYRLVMVLSIVKSGIEL